MAEKNPAQNLKDWELLKLLRETSEQLGAAKIDTSNVPLIEFYVKEVLRRLEEAKKTRLVFLSYGENSAHGSGIDSLQISLDVPIGITVSDNSRSWSSENDQAIEVVGKTARIKKPQERRGLIGVYNTNNPEHLKTMLVHATEAVSNGGYHCV